jgi:hypothetical protein
VTFAVGRTVLLAPRRKRDHCRLGANPDRACSPGAYYAKLTRKVICSPGFRTRAIRNVSDSTRFAVEAAYGLKPGRYGETLEIDHIIRSSSAAPTTSPTSFPRSSTPPPATGSPGWKTSCISSSAPAGTTSAQANTKSPETGNASTSRLRKTSLKTQRLQTACGVDGDTAATS